MIPASARMLRRKRQREKEEDEARLVPVKAVLEDAVSPETSNRSKRRSSYGITSPLTGCNGSTTPVKGGLQSTELEPLPYEDVNAKSLFSAAELILMSQQKPSSVMDFKSRLATFDLARWNSKPDSISSFNCARFGWQLCPSFDALVCVSCHELIHFSPKSRTMSGFDSKLREAIEATHHAPSCPWRTHFSSVSILSLPKDFDMLRFIHRGANAPSTVLPKFVDHYDELMRQIDLDWLIEASGFKDDEQKENVQISGDSLKAMFFLLLNGWSMDEASIQDGLHCTCCLREVPLWLYRSTGGPEEKGAEDQKETRKFDPVNNHHLWCPWRRLLEEDEAITTPVVLGSQYEHHSFGQKLEHSKRLRDKASLEDYYRLRKVIEEECARANIHKKHRLSAHLVTSLATLMDFLTGSCGTTSLEKSSDGSNCTESLSTPAGLKEGAVQGPTKDECPSEVGEMPTESVNPTATINLTEGEELKVVNGSSEIEGPTRNEELMIVEEPVATKMHAMRSGGVLAPVNGISEELCKEDIMEIEQ